MDGTKKQVDVAFALGKVLLIAECKVKGLSIGWERGDPRAVAERADFVREAIRQADDKAIWLCNHPAGTNYDISSFEWVVGVGVSPFPEFIPERTPYYWLDANRPRMMTPAELFDLVEDTNTPALLEHYQMSFRVKS